MNLIVSGSVYSLMQKIFQNNKEPLFGRVDNIIKLSAFDLATLKEIILITIPITAMMICLPSILLQGVFRNMLNCFVTTPN